MKVNGKIISLAYTYPVSHKVFLYSGGYTLFKVNLHNEYAILGI